MEQSVLLSDPLSLSFTLSLSNTHTPSLSPIESAGSLPGVEKSISHCVIYHIFTLVEPCARSTAVWAPTETLVCSLPLCVWETDKQSDRQTDRQTDRGREDTQSGFFVASFRRVPSYKQYHTTLIKRCWQNIFQSRASRRRPDHFLERRAKSKSKLRPYKIYLFFWGGRC